MELVLDELPQDPEQLQQQLQELAQVVAQQNATIVSLQTKCDAALVERDAAQAEIEKLKLLIRQLQRGQFGRRSERLDPDQLQLGLEELEQTMAAVEAVQEAAAAKGGAPRAPRARRRNLGALPVHLPRVEVLLDVEDNSCASSGGAQHALGENHEEKLLIIFTPARTYLTSLPGSG